MKTQFLREGTLHGSNDGVNFTQIIPLVISSTPTGAYQSFEFQADSLTPYLYYRLVAVKTWGSDPLSIGQIELYGTDEPPPATGCLWTQNGANIHFATGNVGIGTTNATHALTVSGTIRAKEIIVESNWADYVFNDDYQLQSLDAVEQHIKQKKHLPGIPSAQEVSEKGVSLGEMQTLLLAKIEELTLHQIELNKRLNAQDAQIRELRAQNEQLLQQSR